MGRPSRPRRSLSAAEIDRSLACGPHRGSVGQSSSSRHDRHHRAARRRSAASRPAASRPAQPALPTRFAPPCAPRRRVIGRCVMGRCVTTVSRAVHITVPRAAVSWAASSLSPCHAGRSSSLVLCRPLITVSCRPCHHCANAGRLSSPCMHAGRNGEEYFCYMQNALLEQVGRGLQLQCRMPLQLYADTASCWSSGPPAGPTPSSSHRRWSPPYHMPPRDAASLLSLVFYLLSLVFCLLSSVFFCLLPLALRPCAQASRG